MAKFLQILERAWLLAAAVAIAVFLYNLVTIRALTSAVYFPVFCAGFCLLIYKNINGQRKFREKFDPQNPKG